MILALTPFLWIFDPAPLDWGSFFTNFEETIFLRRSVLVEGVVWVHGLASAYASHLMGILYNKDMLQMVQPGLGEFQSHRVHYLSTVQTLYHARPDPGHTSHCAPYPLSSLHVLRAYLSLSH